MSYCSIYYPGLLGPDVPLDELPKAEWPLSNQLPALALLLNRGQITDVKKTTMERQLLTLLGYAVSAEDELPIAVLREQREIDNEHPHWCLDPVSLQIDREMAYLAAYEELDLSEPEAHELISSIHRHFGDELHIQYLSPHHWLLRTELQLHTFTPSEAMLQDVTRFQPTGPDAKRWRSVLNEIQMLLHAHPVNEARLHAAMPPVNSVWLWGGGKVNRMAADYDLLCSDNLLAIQAAAQNKIAHSTVPEQISAAMFLNLNVLIVLLEQTRAIQRRDVYAWFDSMRQLEQSLLSPLLGLLKTGTLEYLQLHSDTVSVKITKTDINKWWRRIKPFDAMMKSLRQQHGY